MSALNSRGGGYSSDLPLISIIIPAYNAEKYIEKCLDSVKSQTYTNFECIVVNDGSKDSTKDICEKFSQDDSRFVTINKQNGGCAVARNIGLDKAHGDYITFLDADDYIDNNSFESMLSVAVRENTDVVIFGFWVEWTGRSKEVRAVDKVTVVNGTSRIMAMYCTNKGITGLLWNKLYKKELFDNLRLPNIAVSEDNATTYKILDRSSRAVVIPDLLYYYNRHGDSADSIHFKSIARHFVSVDVAEERYKFIAIKYPELEKDIDCNRWNMYRAMFLRLFMCGGWIKYKEELQRYITFVKTHNAPNDEFASFKKAVLTVPHLYGLYIHVRHQLTKAVKKLIHR